MTYDIQIPAIGYTRPLTPEETENALYWSRFFDRRVEEQNLSTGHGERGPRPPGTRDMSCFTEQWFATTIGGVPWPEDTNEFGKGDVKGHQVRAVHKRHYDLRVYANEKEPGKTPLWFALVWYDKRHHACTYLGRIPGCVAIVLCEERPAHWSRPSETQSFFVNQRHLR